MTAHFDSKEDLVAKVVADQLREQRETYSAQSLEEIVRGYLSDQAPLVRVAPCAGTQNTKVPLHMRRKKRDG